MIVRRLNNDRVVVFMSMLFIYHLGSLVVNRICRQYPTYLQLKMFTQEKLKLSPASYIRNKKHCSKIKIFTRVPLTGEFFVHNLCVALFLKYRFILSPVQNWGSIKVPAYRDGRGRRCPTSEAITRRPGCINNFAGQSSACLHADYHIKQISGSTTIRPIQMHTMLQHLQSKQLAANREGGRWMCWYCIGQRFKFT